MFPAEFPVVRVDRFVPTRWLRFKYHSWNYFLILLARPNTTELALTTPNLRHNLGSLSYKGLIISGVQII